MKKYMIIDNDIENKDETEYEYEIGEEILIDSHYWVKCVRKEIINNELLQYFITKISMYKDEYKTLINEKAELLQALKDLWSVRSEPWTDEQKQYKFKVECEVEEIIKKYL